MSTYRNVSECLDLSEAHRTERNTGHCGLIEDTASQEWNTTPWNVHIPAEAYSKKKVQMTTGWSRGSTGGHVEAGDLVACSLVDHRHPVALHDAVRRQRDGLKRSEEDQVQLRVLTGLVLCTRGAHRAGEEELRPGIPDDPVALDVKVSLDVKL